MVFMFAQQTMRIKALLEILRSNGILEKDDFDVFERMVYHEMSDEMFSATAAQYTEFASSLGLQDSLPKTEPPH